MAYKLKAYLHIFKKFTGDILNILSSYFAHFLHQDAVVEWLERLALVVGLQVRVRLGLKNWKTFTVHPAVNGYLINFREG